MERDFLSAHIVPWIETLRAELCEKSQHAYYRAVADLAVEFTQRDLRTLEDLLGPSRSRPVPDYEGMPS